MPATEPAPLRSRHAPNTRSSPAGRSWAATVAVRGGTVFVPLVCWLVALPAVAAEIPATVGLATGPAAEGKPADLLAPSGAAEVAGGVLGHRGRVADDAQRPSGGRQRRARYQV